MKKNLLLGAAALLFVSMTALGTWSYFSDTETSTGNTITAGTLNLELANDGSTFTDGVTASFTADNLAPGDSVPSAAAATITLKNAGTVEADHVEITFANAVTDNATYDVDDLGANVADISTVLNVTTLTYNGVDLLAKSGEPLAFTNTDILALDADVDGIIQLDELNAITLDDMAAPAAGGTNVFTIQLLAPTDVGNGIQGDEVTVTITFGLYQDASQ